jgi:hypothetical protein
MATINHSSGADIIVPNNNGTTYRGLGGDDTYILSNSIAANAAITIVDTSGANKIQLVDGLSVASTKFAADAVQLTLSNGAVVTINGASNFNFDLGGNATAGTSGSVSDFAGFAAGAGVATLPSSGSVAGASNVTVSGAAWSGGGASYTVTKTASSVSEGDAVTFTITSSSAVTADTTFSWTVIGDTNGATVTAAGTSDIDVLSGSATIASGATSTTFDVTASSDSIVEGIEGIKVSVFDANSTALSSSTILLNNTGSAATSQSFTMTTGVDEQVGGSGNDTFNASGTTNSLNDFDNIDGAGGTDTVVAKLSGADAYTIAPVMKNIEQISVTSADTGTANDGNGLTVNLAEATSITKVMNITSVDAVKFDNLSNIVTAEVKSSVNDTTVVYDKGVLAGASDNMNLIIKGTNATDVSIESDSSTAVLENLTINIQSVANTLDDLATTDVKVPKITITGDKLLTITAALDAEVVTIDSSASTGGLTLSAAPGYGGVTVTGGSGVETITVGAGNVNVSGGAGNDVLSAAGTWNGADVFDGGDGTDTLALTDSFQPLNTGPASANTIAAGLSNVENLSMTGANTVISLDKAMGSLNTLLITDAAKQTVNLNDGYVGDTSIFIATAASSTNRDAVEKIVNTANVDLSIYAKVGDIDGDSNTKTTITGGYGQDTLYLYNIVSGDTIALLGDGNNNNITNVDKIVILDGTAGNDVTIDTGDYALTSAAGAAIPLTIDGSAMGPTEVLTTGVGGTSLAKMNVIGGDASDILTGGTLADTISGGAGNDTIDIVNGAGNLIDGGAGNDIITTGEGVDNISGGAGNDTIAAENNLQLTDTIDGGEGTDTLTIGANITSASVFGSVSNIEVITPAAAEDITVTGALGGATTFDFSNAGKNELTISSTGTYTSDTTVTFGAALDANGNDDKVVNSNNVTLTVNALDEDIDAGTTLTGGTGTDTLNITATGGGTGAVLTAVTNFEAINVVDAVTAGTNIKITPNLTTTKTQNISASELDGSTQNDEQLTLVVVVLQVSLM